MDERTNVMKNNKFSNDEKCSSSSFVASARRHFVISSFNKFCRHFSSFIVCLALSPVIAHADVQDRLAPRAPAVLYVKPDGVDYSECTKEFPCRDIRKAADAAQPGDIITIAAGDYPPFKIKEKHGTKAAPIYIVGEGDVRITPNGSSERDNIFVTYCDWIVVTNIGSFHANRAGIRVDNSHHITIRNSRFGDNMTWGIFANHANDILIENNETYGSRKQHGIYFSNSADRPTIRGNRSHDNIDCGIHLNGDLSMGEGRDVVGDGTVSGAVIENNIVYGNGKEGGAAINLDGVEDSIVRNNLLYDNHATGIALFKGDGAKGPSNVKVINNTIDMAADARWSIAVKNASGPVYVFNNILLNRNLGRGALDLGESSSLPKLLARFGWMGKNADMNNVVSDYNIFAGGKGIVTLNDNESRFDLTVWKKDGHDTHSFFVNETASLFKDLLKQDYHLPEKSPALDRGLASGEVKADLEKNARPQGAGTDIGAFEAVK
jgi:hypothetical protein